MTSRIALSRPAGFVAAAYAYAVAMLGTTLPTPLYPSYQEQWGFSDLTITVIFATYAVGVIAALLLSAGSPTRSGAGGRCCPDWPSRR